MLIDVGDAHFINAELDDDGNVVAEWIITGKKIILCKECRYYDEVSIFGNTLCSCCRNTEKISVEPDGFCYFAVEKEDS